MPEFVYRGHRFTLEETPPPTGWHGESTWLLCEIHTEQRKKGRAAEFYDRPRPLLRAGNVRQCLEYVARITFGDIAEIERLWRNAHERN